MLLRKDVKVNKLVIGCCSNIDNIYFLQRESKNFLNGASIYSGYSAARILPTTVITCVGDEPENDELIEKAKKYREFGVPRFDIIKIRGGKSFRQTFGREKEKGLEVIGKDYGNYNDWNPDVPEFQTKTLLLGTANPIFQKAVLDSCIHSDNIMLDSKCVHIQKRANKVNELLRRVDTFFGTDEEIEAVLKNFGLINGVSATTLFSIFPNLKVIISKSGAKGGTAYLKDGTYYKYAPVKPATEICSDGAGDVFAGTYAAQITIGKSVKEAILESAKSASESVKHFGINKVQKIENIDNVKINIEEGRWKREHEQDTNRSSK